MELVQQRSRVDDSLASLVALGLDAEQGKSLALAKRALKSIDAFMVRILRSEQTLSERFDRLIVLRDELDGLLDEDIQALVARDIARSHAQADSSISAAIDGMTYGFAGLAAAFVLAIGLLSRMILVPPRRIVDAAVALGHGELDRRVRITSRSEFGALAQVFNNMADSVQQAHVELEHANTRLSELVAELRRAGERLEDRVKERTEELERVTVERLTAEDALRRKQRELAHVHRLNTASEMAFAFIHEIGQPLTAISAYAASGTALLPIGTAQSEDLRTILSKIQVQGTRAREVLGSIRGQMRHARSNETSIKLNELIAATERLLNFEADRSPVAFSLDLADGLPNVRGDPIQLEQVIVNLELNAIEAMSGSGTPAKRLRIITSRAGTDAVKIDIEDSGPGIHAAMIGKVFEPFYSTKNDSMGMGLAISRTIVEAMGGRLWATSDGASGATFHIWLLAEA